jgi:hypothetical protein
VAGNLAQLNPSALTAYLARMSVQELAQFYDGLRIWAPDNLEAQQQVAEELRRRARTWTDGEGARS